ncbi:hypothetical protein C8A00DRAFT_39398 [Chaetomidium leptoderma]|uniref:Uncharacterized protein n=1 Tax=Chaetomidium leptoderma TaxID=669021 RepID=A0AAN6VX49_9PEZI|nr:hypothetical protein C8A00DRAFT_39398 [Chaetomidium leptoderma]
MESFFDDAEKRSILAEMIKLSQLDVGVLVDFVKAHQIQPDWLHMQLPRGRNMSQCLHAAESMFGMPMPPPVISSLKRKSLGDLPDYVSDSNKRQAIASPGEMSPRAFPPGPNMQPASGAHPVNIQPRPNGYAPALPAPTPSISSAPYNPAPTGRKRGRPPKSVQNTWQVSTYQHITPAPIAPSPVSATAPQPHSPGLRGHPAHQLPAQGLPDPKLRKKALPEIAPRPAQGVPSAEPAVRSPAVPAAEYQTWRDETSRREHYQVQASEPPPRERPACPASTYAQILPRPRSPFPHPRELPRPTSTEPRHVTAASPPSPSEPVKKESQPATTEPVKP